MSVVEEEFYDAKEFSETDVDDFYEDEEQKEKCLQEFRAWAKSQPHFVRCRLDNDFLLRFLRMRKYCVPLAQQVLEKYLTVRTRYPHYYQKLDIKEFGVRDLISRGYIFPLPERDRDGRIVLFCIAGALDSSRHKQSDVFRSFMITYEALMESEVNQIRGLSYIFTQEGYQLSHALLVGLRDLQRMVHIGEKAIPLRHKKLHWMNVPRYLSTLFIFLKTFLSQKLQDRIVLHLNMNSLYDHFPPSMLPKEYGGTVPVSEMTARWIEELDSKRERLLALDEMRLDDSKRVKAKHSSRLIPRLISGFTKMELY